MDSYLTNRMGHKCLLDSARLSVASREEMGFGQVTGETCSCTTKTDEKELATKMERNKKRGRATRHGPRFRDEVS